MKFKVSQTEFKQVFWSGHYQSCEKCREVDLDKPSTFINACGYPGSALLNEELQKRQAPIVREKAAAVREWAKKTGVFKGA